MPKIPKIPSAEDLNMKKAALIASGILSPLGGLAVAPSAEASHSSGNSVIQRVHQDEKQLNNLFSQMVALSKESKPAIKVYKKGEDSVYEADDPMAYKAEAKLLAYLRPGETKPYKYETKLISPDGTYDNVYFVSGGEGSNKPAKLVQTGPAGKDLLKVITVDSEGHYLERLNGRG